MQLMMPVSVSCLSQHRRTTLISVLNLHFSENQVFMEFQTLTNFRHVLKDSIKLDWREMVFRTFSKFPHYWVNAKCFHVDVGKLNKPQKDGNVSSSYNNSRPVSTMHNRR
jgi:hypothetical protein